MAAAVLSTAGTAWAAPAWRLSLDPGLAALTPPFETRHWGWQGGGSAGVALGEQLWLEAHAERTRFAGRKPPVDVDSLGLAVSYRLDTLYVSPFLAAGAAKVRVEVATLAEPLTDTVATFSAGFDVRASGLLWGAGVRYYALFDSDLLGRPAYAILFGRIGVLLGT